MGRDLIALDSRNDTSNQSVDLDKSITPIDPTTFFRAIVDNSDDAIVTCNADGTIISWNTSAERIFGCRAAQMIGSSVDLLFPPDLVDRARNVINLVAQGNQADSLNSIVTDCTGKRHDLQISLSPIRGEDQKPVAVALIVRDQSAHQELLRNSRHFAALVESSDDAIIGKTLEGIVTSWNQGAEAMFGYSAEEMIGQSILRLFPPDRLHEEREILHQLKAGNRVRHFRSVRIHKSGRAINVLVTVSPVVNSQGDIIGASKIAKDVTEQQLIEKQAKHYEALVTSSVDAVISETLEGIVTSWNPAAERIFGYSADEMIGQPITVLFPSELLHEERLMLNKIARGQHLEHFRSRRVCSDGREIQVEISISPIRSKSGDIIGASKIARDITEQAEMEALIQHQARFDSLTNLFNRAYLGQKLDDLIAESDSTGQPFAVIYLDLDRFKSINDRFGHGVGDLVLHQTSERLLASVRKTDMVSRFGGDEFVVLLPSLESEAIANDIAHKIIDNIKKPIPFADTNLLPSASAGVAIKNMRGITSNELLQMADRALYKAKSNGRNCVCMFDRSLKAGASVYHKLVTDLPFAFKRQQMMLNYQPIVDLRTLQVSKVEALIRWKHPELGMISPVEFIPIAEDHGVIKELGQWVFETAIERLAEWNKAFGHQFQISINKSPLQLLGSEMPLEKWCQQLDQVGLTASNIILEITESSLMQHTEMARDRLGQFRNRGFQVAMDDFGTGYSSLSYLNRFDFDYIKIDKSFIRNIASSERDQSLSEAIIAMAQKLEIGVVAEGIEDAEQRAILTAMGCDYGQGYHFARPMNSSQFVEFMQQLNDGALAQFQPLSDPTA